MRLKILVLPGLESVVRMQQGEVMSPKIELEAVANKAEKIDDWVDWSGLYHQGIAEMMANPKLTDAEKQELLRQLELPDEEWEPIALPEGAEPLSVTIIKMRHGEKEALMSPTLEVEPQKNGYRDWSSLYEFCITDMLANPNLTDTQKQELLKELVMPEDEWKPIELPEGSESLSETIIKMRRGE
ncbi:MAG TPA: hypothetical protein PKC13_05755 [Blastocatellia bacterium]|nr:hypothetical protein [Blastocatellia bacterium]HMV86351.1 hypothetical protein [Blastocatellia bacterium]HMX25115.1 hypothetical protein [Blastocatellia bacterium]